MSGPGSLKEVKNWREPITEMPFQHVHRMKKNLNMKYISYDKQGLSNDVAYTLHQT